MSTNSFIAIKIDGNLLGLDSDVYKTVYNHSDGYPEYTLAVLRHFYNSETMAHKLINNGYISLLGAEIGQKIDFDSDVRRSGYVKMIGEDQTACSQCIFYHRDRGDELEIKFYTEKKLASIANYDHVYIFDGEWKEYKSEKTENTAPGIYLIQNLYNGRYYVGYSLEDVDAGLAETMRDLENNCFWHSFLQNSFNKHGKYRFRAWVIERLETQEETLDIWQEILTRYREAAEVYNYNTD